MYDSWRPAFSRNAAISEAIRSTTASSFEYSNSREWRHAATSSSIERAASAPDSGRRGGSCADMSVERSHGSEISRYLNEREVRQRIAPNRARICAARAPRVEDGVVAEAVLPEEADRLEVGPRDRRVGPRAARVAAEQRVEQPPADALALVPHAHAEQAHLQQALPEPLAHLEAHRADEPLCCRRVGRRGGGGGGGLLLVRRALVGGVGGGVGLVLGDALALWQEQEQRCGTREQLARVVGRDAG